MTAVRELLERYANGDREFGAIDLTEVNLSRANLAGINLNRASLSIANLSGANLSGANLAFAKLNVARLSGANLVRANLSGAILNVANLIRANLTEAELSRAALIRAETIRADLSRANLTEANLNGADLREAKLRQATLDGANLGECDLRGASAIAATFVQANLNGSDLSQADLSGADLSFSEMRHARLQRANLSGASLRGANLRWADLSGADLRWADLSEAKLSGANLIGANLSNANLLNASFVHADLTQANLIRADWEGSDLSGAILTGAKLYGVSRFSLRTEGTSCDWVDMSTNGDRTRICRFTPEDFQKFFNQTPPTVRISIDTPIDWNANFALAQFYDRLSQDYPEMSQPPSIDVGYRRTTLTFRVDGDDLLFPTAYIGILPFEDAEATQKSILAFIKAIQSNSSDAFGVKESHRISKLSVALIKKIRKASEIERPQISNDDRKDLDFFKASTQVVLANSSDTSLVVHHNPMFGKRLLHSAGGVATAISMRAKSASLPPASELLEFIQGFYSFEESGVASVTSDQ